MKGVIMEREKMIEMWEEKERKKGRKRNEQERGG